MSSIDMESLMKKLEGIDDRMERDGDLIRDGSYTRSIEGGKTFNTLNISDILASEIIKSAHGGGKSIITVNGQAMIFQLPKSSEVIRDCELQLEYEDGTSESVSNSHVVLMNENSKRITSVDYDNLSTIMHCMNL